ncbi:MAG: aldo/keto reductase [Archaeoglobaceae archaeon]|nr:aldo/keto reductase [Archaeoglobaceae archaeon]MCX8151726.1 aldo/keto reductase [Archaeoglobaceae archaeon]MDW8013855.1 aldo/keto reductase [Archaeoglobaceae archaeon]
MFEIDLKDYKELGKSGEKISAVGVGTWGIVDRRSAIEALTYAVQLGLNHIDTAEMYLGAEEIVGEVVKDVGREKVFITTKILPSNFRDFHLCKKAAENCLKRLKVDQVDLILIHWPESYLSIEKVVNFLEKLVDEGYTRYIGVSNFSKYELEKAVESVKRYEISVNQVKYSVYDKRIELELLPYMIREKITLQAYTPLERGEVAYDRFLKNLGEKYKKTAVQIALNYLISHKEVVAIPKTERRERIIEFKGAMGWRLSLEDINLLKSKNFKF